MVFIWENRGGKNNISMESTARKRWRHKCGGESEAEDGVKASRMGKGGGIGSSGLGWASMMSRWKGEAGWIFRGFSGGNRGQEKN